jgi:hypothetical protein
MGLMSRQKGKTFERRIAAIIRDEWPSAIVRRASQSERADNPDVFIEGGPPLLARLWLELQDARSPDPRGKLAQAEGDVLAWQARRATADRLPVVIWHRLGERTTWATLRLSTLLAIAEPRPDRAPLAEVITCELPALLGLIRRASEPVPVVPALVPLT